MIDDEDLSQDKQVVPLLALSFYNLVPSNEHKDYALEIIEKSQAYTNLMNKGIVDEFQGVFHSPQEVHQFVWGKHLDMASQENRPLSKFTKDILEQLGISQYSK